MSERNNDYAQLKEAMHEVGAAFEEFKTENDAMLEKKADGKAVAEQLAKIERIDAALEEADKKHRAAINTIEADRARIEDLEARIATGLRSGDQGAKEAHLESFVAYLQNPRANALDKLYTNETKYRATLPQTKQINLASAAAGEALVPEIIVDEIEKMEKKNSPIRNLIPVRTVGSTDFKQTVDIGGAASGWLAETGTRTVTANSTLRVRTPTWGELYARPQASEWSMMDIPGAMAWIAEMVADEFISAEGIAVLTGNGTNKPTGILNTAPLTTDDWASPLRSAEAIEDIVAPSPDDISEHVLMLIYALNGKYRNGSKFAMNSVTLGEVRRAKDSNGQYLWQPSFQSGEPSMIAGYGFEVLEDMDNTGLSPVGHPILFGNWSRAYLLAQRSDVMLLVDPYTTIGLVSYWFRRREGGIILNNDALKAATR